MIKKAPAQSAKSKQKFFVLLSTIFACILLSIYGSFFMNITLVYTHFYYIPILLAGIWYQKKAVYIALGLGTAHVLIAFFSAVPLTGSEFARASIFIVVAYIVGLVSEEKAKGEEKLRVSEEKYRAFFTTSRDPVFITTKEGGWIDLNDAAVELFGYETRDELLAVNVSDLYENPEERKRHIQVIEQEGYTKNYPLNLHKKDGGVINVLVTSVTIKGESGNVVGYQGTIRDITERKQAEKERERLLNELETLELSRIGRVVNPPEVVLFAEIVKEALEQTAGALKTYDILVSVAEDFPAVHVDRMRMVEVLVNLITNSIKYRGEQSSPKIEVGYREANQKIIFFVKDNGIGIDKSQYEKVFELFYKVDKSSSGTGAGLAIVKCIIEVHGGRIWIESEKGKGCTVCFTVPTIREGEKA